VNNFLFGVLVGIVVIFMGLTYKTAIELIKEQEAK